MRQRTLTGLIIAVWVGMGSITTWSSQTNSFEFRDGDRVVFVGDHLVEGEQRYGYIEYMLSTRFPERDVRFRHLGWNTPGLFNWSDPPKQWLDRLSAQLRELKPTVLWIGYGTEASSVGEKGVGGFKKWLGTLVDGARGAESESEVRLIFLSPIRQEKGLRASVKPEVRNRQLALYGEAVRELAQEREARHVDLYKDLHNSYFLDPGPPMMEAGLRLSEYGYRRAAEVVAQVLGWFPPNWQFGLTEDGQVREGTYGLKVEQLETAPRRIRFLATEEILVFPRWLQGEPVPPTTLPSCRMQIKGLTEGLYQLKIDGQVIQSVSAGVLASSGIVVGVGPQFDQAEALLQQIRKKNEILSAGRSKQAQGEGASGGGWSELAREVEQRIAVLRKPVQHAFEVEVVEEEPGKE